MHHRYRSYAGRTQLDGTYLIKQKKLFMARSGLFVYPAKLLSALAQYNWAMRPRVHYAITAAAGALALTTSATPVTAQPAFGPAHPFYAPSNLPFQAPPFDKIQDSDYQPA